MGRYRSVRNGRRKTPTICPTQRDNRKRTHICADSGGECTPSPEVNAESAEGTGEMFVLSLPAGYPQGASAQVSVWLGDTLIGLFDASVTMDTMTIPISIGQSEGDQVTIFVPAQSGFCAFVVITTVVAG